MKELDQLLVQYNALQEQEVSIKSQKDQLKEEIFSWLSAMGKKDYLTEDGTIKGITAFRTNVKYDDELAIIDYLKKNGMEVYLKTTIDTTNFNKTLKSSQSLQESLSGKFSMVESPTLTVKKVI